MKKTVFSPIVLISTVVCSVFLAGCSGSENESGNPEIDTAQKAWESQVLDDNLIADFRADENPTAQLNAYLCVSSALPVEKIRSAFFYADTSGFRSDRLDQGLDVTKYGYLYTLESEDGLEIYSSFEGNSGETKEADFYRNFLAYDRNAWDGSRPADLGTGEELDFLDKTQIEEEIRAGWKALYPDSSPVEINFFTLSADYLNDLQSRALAELKEQEDTSWYEREAQYERDWRREDGAYYVTVDFEIGGIPVSGSANVRLTNEAVLTGYTASFIYNKNGCVYLKMPALWEIKEQNAGEGTSVAEALEFLKKDITSVILTNESIVDNAELNYVLVRIPSSTEFEIQPMWIFDVQVKVINSKKEGSAEYYVKERYYVNALTGEVLR